MPNAEKPKTPNEFYMFESSREYPKDLVKSFCGDGRWSMWGAGLELNWIPWMGFAKTKYYELLR